MIEQFNRVNRESAKPEQIELKRPGRGPRSWPRSNVVRPGLETLRCPPHTAACTSPGATAFRPSASSRFAPNRTNSHQFAVILKGP